jgi:hypothetical protein
MKGKNIIKAILILSESYFSYKNAKDFGEYLLTNCIISQVPYNPFSDFEEDKYYCFVVKYFF